MPKDFNFGELRFSPAPLADVTLQVHKLLLEKDKKIAELQLQVTQLQGTIADLNERLEANGL